MRRVVSFRNLAVRRGASVALIGVLSFALEALATGFAGIPVPTVHDEFCYLLAGDTFAQGRAANPVHPLWEHFESFHLIQRPGYAAKYPPMQGLFLALGQHIGHPIIGVWLSMALASAAVAWMLQQWLPGRWALVGGLLFLFHPRIFWEWGQTYMGGAAAVLGGAVVFGALRAIFRKPTAGLGILLGVGLAILANSRPFEGFLLCVPAGWLLLGALVRDEPPTLRRRVLLPLALTAFIVVLVMGYYHWRVTGDPLRMPYQEHEDQYGMTPIFLWQEARPEPAYRHQELRDFHAGWAMRIYHARRTLDGFLAESWSRLETWWAFFLGPMLTIPLLTLPWMLKDRLLRFAFLSCLLLMGGLAAGMWFAPHYAAPMVGPIFILIVQGLRLLSAALPWRFMRKALVAGLLLAWLVQFGLSFRAHRPNAGYAWPRYRAQLLAQLEQDSGRHLILVRYGREHSPHCEWVYNAADIDGAKVVWARDMGAEKNARLMNYFQDRRAWVLEVDADTRAPELEANLSQRRQGAKENAK